jgi:hypothetical protein
LAAEKISTKELKRALDEWRERYPGQAPDLERIFETDRLLFLDLASAKMSKDETSENQELSSLAKLARRTLHYARKVPAKRPRQKPRSSPKPSSTEKSPTEIELRTYKLAPNRAWLFHGTQVSTKTIGQQMPESSRAYHRLLEALKKQDLTKRELGKMTGMPSERLQQLLHYLGQSCLVKATKRGKKPSRFSLRSTLVR